MDARQRRRSTARPVGVVLGMLLIGACGPSVSNDAYERTNHACAPGACPDASVVSPTADASLGDEALEPWPDTNAGLLSGVFAVHAIATATIADVQISLQLLYRLRILQEPTGQLRQSTTICALKLPSVKGIATLKVPPRLQDVIAAKSTVEAEGDFLTTVGGAQTYAPPPLVFVFGAKLANPATDPLPTMTDLATAWDEDMDGHPGVTIDANVFLCTEPQELYVAIRTAGTLKGTVTGFDTIEGTGTISEAESVLGYSNACLSEAANLKPMLSPTAPFKAQRLADESQLHTSGNVTCSDIVAAAPKLYGSVWADD